MEVEDNRGEADRDRHQHHGEEQVATWAWIQAITSTHF
jgi:hypothetical protein